MSREETQYKSGSEHPYFGKSSPAKGKHWKLSPETKARMSLAQNKRQHPWQADSLHHGWKGSKVQYRALHSWITRKLGRPEHCEFCSAFYANPTRKLHWANKSGLYLRELSDWLRLCAKCHKEYDKAQQR